MRMWLRYAMKSNMTVDRISRQDYLLWVLDKHYAHREPPVSFAFGLFDKNILCGVCTFGVPSSSPLRRGICGDKYEGLVFELNRLVIETDAKNAASFFVSRCLLMMPRPSIIISYADTEHRHIGYVYQACNFIYTGLSAKRTDWKIRGLEHLHGQTVADISRGERDRVGYMRRKFGDSFYLEGRSRKHRYVYFLGSKKETKQMRIALRYKIEPYPKGDSIHYNAPRVDVQARMF